MKSLLIIRRYLTALMLLSICNVAIATEASPQVQQQIRSSLEVLLPGIEPEKIYESVVPGLYEVIFGPRLVYMTADGKYLVQGSIINLETRENLTEPKLEAAKIAAIDKVGNNNMMVYSPPKGTKVAHQVNIFTDIDCGYCRKLHAEMKDYNDLGIEIRYLFYPRAGKGSVSYQKALSVWCAEDKFKAMDESKAGKEIPIRTECKNPVDAHMMLGELVGVTGTPAMVLSDGKMIPGYVPAQRLKQVLDSRK